MLIPEWPAPRRVVAAVTTRAGGVSAGPFSSLNLGTHVGDDPSHVAENRRRLRQQLALPGEPLWLSQVHGTEAVRAEAVTGGVDADAAYSSQPGVICAVLTADCLPVLLCNRAGTRVAAAHAGWAGLKAGVLESTATCFDVGDELLAWMGPAISQAHFEVGPEVREGFLDAASDSLRELTAAAFLPSLRPGHWMADLYTLARIRLEALGAAVFGGGLCTFADAERFYSYRRDKVTGRMASLIYIKP